MVPFTSVLTFFMLPLFLYWYPNLKVRCMYGEALNLKDKSRVVELVRDGLVSNVMVTDSQGRQTIVPVRKEKDVATGAEIIYFTYMHIIYEMGCPTTAQQDDCESVSTQLSSKLNVCQEFGFYPRIFNEFLTHRELLQLYSRGTEADQVAQLQQKFGECQITVEIPSVGSLFMEEVLSPFFLFQYFSIMLWLVEAYINYAIAIAAITSYSIVSGIYDAIKSTKKIK